MTLRLHFSPAFDNGCYVPEPKEGNSILRERYVGPMGLLEELELRAGLTSRKTTPHQMLASYSAAVKKAAAADASLFFAQSVKIAPLSTAEQIMNWRDALVFCGWKAGDAIPNSLTSGAKSILDGIKSIEPYLNGFRSVSDRWRAVLDTASKESVLTGAEIVVHVEKKALHPVYSRLLDALESHGTSVTYLSRNSMPQTEFKRFKDSADACLWTAMLQNDALLICRDSSSLSTAMKAVGHKSIASSSSYEGRPVEHLFTSGMMLLLNPSDINSLRDYLSSPSHPLCLYTMDKNGIKVSLRSELLSHIVACNGKGKSHITKKTFDEIISDFAAACNVTEDEIMKYIPSDKSGLSFKKIKDLCDALSKWCTFSLSSSAPEYLQKWGAQWASVLDSCSALVFMLKESGLDRVPTISGNDFLNALRYADRPSEISVSVAEKGSSPIVSSVDSIAEDVKDAVWVDPCMSFMAFKLAFLCDEDIKVLRRDLNLDIQTRSDFLISSNSCIKAGLSHVKGNLTVLACDRFLGKSGQRHPVVIEIAGTKAGNSNANVLDWLDSLPYEAIPGHVADKMSLVNPSTQQLDYTVNDLPKMALPDHESPSSLEKLFERPFDHVVSNVLDLRDENSYNISTIMGTVAHGTISKLYYRAVAAANNPEVSADAFETEFKAHFDDDFAASIEEMGMELRLPENKIECKQLCYNLQKKSIPKLIEIIRYSNLTIVGSEVACDLVDITDNGPNKLIISASIDLLLKNNVNHYVIIDFKWTSGSTGVKMRMDQIKKGHDYQLALYRRLCEKGTASIQNLPVDAQAFYMLKTCELLTAYNAFSDASGAIRPINPVSMTYAGTLNEIHSKYDSFVKDFNAGIVREGGGMKGSGGKTIPDNSYGENLILKGKLK